MFTRGRGLSFLGSAWSWRIGVVLRAIGNMCGGRDVNIVVPLYTKLLYSHWSPSHIGNDARGAAGRYSLDAR